MRPNNLAAAQGKLADDRKRLRMLWDNARAEWDDPVSRDFEEKRLVPLEQDTEAAVHAIDELRKVLQQMERALENHE